MLIEWFRRAHVDKSIKAKVVRMINKKHSNSKSPLLNMNKLQLEEYFDNLRKEAQIRINDDVIALKLEREHYTTFIKKEL